MKTLQKAIADAMHAYITHGCLARAKLNPAIIRRETGEYAFGSALEPDSVLVIDLTEGLGGFAPENASDIAEASRLWADMVRYDAKMMG